MRLHITTTKGISGVNGALVLDSGQRAYRGHYADVERALYQGCARALQLARGLWGVSIDGVDVEPGEVVARLKAYLDCSIDGVVGVGSRRDVVDGDQIRLMIELVEDGGVERARSLLKG